ncbi:hypothetical protein HMPREF2847_08650 [Corynebacterium sp. HMSC074C03]|nr:hypothetical protein HMPREF2847_08650 [Corynebacterium sp. HMSC074C03]
MRMLMDEVFGAANFVAEVVWQKGSHVRNDSTTISSSHDVIIVYGKRGDRVINKLPPSCDTPMGDFDVQM